MIILKNELHAVEENLLIAKKSFKKYRKVHYWLENSSEILFTILCLAIVTTIGCLYHQKVKATLMFVDYFNIVALSFFPCTFSFFIIDFLYQPYVWLVFKMSVFKKSSYESEKSKIEDLKTKKWEIRRQIEAEELSVLKEKWLTKEKEFLYNLKELAAKIEHKKITFEEAKSIENTLNKFYLEFKSSKFFHLFKSKTYDVWFNVISKYLANYEREILDKPKTILKEEILKLPNQKTPVFSNINSLFESKIESAITNHKSIDDLFKSGINTDQSKSNKKFKQSLVKLDYLKLNEQRKTIGSLGEKFALNWEIKRLEKEGMKEFIDKISHVSMKDDSAGYDILSFNKDGSHRHIEVKATTEDYKAPFYISENEMFAMNNLNNYVIYRIYNLNISSESGMLFTINGNIEMENYFKLSPVSYIASPFSYKD